jgi:hypothetical protein
MNEFLENLKREASANPVMTMAVVAGLLTAAGKFVDAAGHAKGSAAYAKMVENSIKKNQK